MESCAAPCCCGVATFVFFLAAAFSFAFAAARLRLSLDRRGPVLMAQVLTPDTVLVRQRLPALRHGKLLRVATQLAVPARGVQASLLRIRHKLTQRLLTVRRVLRPQRLDLALTASQGIHATADKFLAGHRHRLTQTRLRPALTDTDSSTKRRVRRQALQLLRHKLLRSRIALDPSAVQRLRGRQRLLGPLRHHLGADTGLLHASPVIALEALQNRRELVLGGAVTKLRLRTGLTLIGTL
jgi:hypothetical protein